jgi:hypothetical protein
VCLRSKEASQIAVRDPVVVTSIHLDATDERKRVGQLRRCLHRSRNFRSKREELEPISALIVGDFNQECFPGSCVSAFLSNSDDGAVVDEADLQKECAAALRLKRNENPTEKQMKEWIDLYNESRDTAKDMCVSLNRVETCETRSAYDHETVVNGKHIMGQWRLDHIIYTSATLQPCAYWSTLESDEESSRIGLPNRRYGADHLPIGALFRLFPSPKLSEDEKAALLETLEDISSRQKRCIGERQTELDTELATMEAKISPVSCSSVVSDSGSSKKKKKKNGPPPQAIVDFMRKRRSILRALKAAQKKERQQWVSTLGNLERLTITNACSLSSSQWVERG